MQLALKRLKGALDRPSPTELSLQKTWKNVLNVLKPIRREELVTDSKAWLSRTAASNPTLSDLVSMAFRTIEVQVPNRSSQGLQGMQTMTYIFQSFCRCFPYQMILLDSIPRLVALWWSRYNPFVVSWHRDEILIEQCIPAVELYNSACGCADMASEISTVSTTYRYAAEYHNI